MIRELLYIDQIRPGYHLEGELYAQMLDHWRWYNGQYGTLRPTPTIGNGYKLFDDQSETVETPFHLLASDFIGNAALAELPTASTERPYPSLVRWLQDNDVMLDKALRRATQYWSVHDLAVFTAEPGFIRAVNPAYYLRVGEAEQRDSNVGHVIAYPYRDTSEDPQARNSPSLLDNPNRLKVIRYSEPLGISDVTTYYFVGSVVGDAVSPTEPSPITGVCVAGRGESWYRGTRDIVRLLHSGWANLQAEINRYSNRVEYFPAGAMEVIQKLYPANTSLAEALSKFRSDRIRPGLGLSGPQDRVPDDNRQTINESTRIEFLSKAEDVYFLLSGLTPSSFGIGQGRNESAAAREKSQDAATARIRAYRKDLSVCLSQLIVAAGAPSGQQATFNWAHPPFESRSSRQEEIMNLFTAGIITVDEARQELGFSPMPNQEQQEDEEVDNGTDS